ncbi:hypothetical protein PCANB_001122 [Pneumocystis canis]|nr:hypothetical protein PCANB_001122 [Pneumocystis canis]
MMHSLETDIELYTPSCNWRRLQKARKRAILFIINILFIRILETNLLKNRKRSKNIDCCENTSAKISFSSSKHVLQQQIDQSKKYQISPKEKYNYRRETRPGKYIALDCEMVQVGPSRKKDHVLARISIVNYHGNVILDTFVKPKEHVVDYKTWINGITQADLEKAPSFEEVQLKVSDLLKNRVLVGHAVKNDLDVLFLSHPKKDIRDTSKFKAFRAYSKGKTPSLKKLAKEILNITIQHNIHSSIEDARTAMLLYKRYKTEMDHA